MDLIISYFVLFFSSITIISSLVDWFTYIIICRNKTPVNASIIYFDTAFKWTREGLNVAILEWSEKEKKRLTILYREKSMKIGDKEILYVYKNFIGRPNIRLFVSDKMHLFFCMSISIIFIVIKANTFYDYLMLIAFFLMLLICALISPWVHLFSLKLIKKDLGWHENI